MENGKLRIFTRNKRDRTDFYPELDEITEKLQAKSAWLDGEIVVFDQNQKPSFYHVLTRERVGDPSRASLYSKQSPARYIVFDIMSLDGKDLRAHPLRQRKAILEEKLAPGRNVAVTHDFSDGDALLNLMKQKGWEGIVSKRADSPYIGGKGTKTGTRQNCIKAPFSCLRPVHERWCPCFPPFGYQAPWRMALYRQGLPRTYPGTLPPPSGKHGVFDI